MELIGTAHRGVVPEKLNEGPKPKGKPLPYGLLLSNLDSNASRGGECAQTEQFIDRRYKQSAGTDFSNGDL